MAFGQTRPTVSNAVLEVEVRGGLCSEDRLVVVASERCCGKSTYKAVPVELSKVAAPFRKQNKLY